MKMIEHLVFKTVTQIRGEITAEGLRKAFGLPPDAEITVYVPDGIDCGGMDLDITINPLSVSWVTDSLGPGEATPSQAEEEDEAGDFSVVKGVRMKVHGEAAGCLVYWKSPPVPRPGDPSWRAATPFMMKVGSKYRRVYAHTVEARHLMMQGKMFINYEGSKRIVSFEEGRT